MIKPIIFSAISLGIFAIVAVVVFVGAKHLAKDHQERIGSTIVWGSALILFAIMGSGAGLKMFLVGTGTDLKIPGLGG